MMAMSWVSWVVQLNLLIEWIWDFQMDPGVASLNPLGFGFIAL